MGLNVVISALVKQLDLMVMTITLVVITDLSHLSFFCRELASKEGSGRLITSQDRQEEGPCCYFASLLADILLLS